MASQLTINSNIAALQANRRLSEATNSLRQVFERLSSGQRINRASDDAAGLSISEGLRVDTAVYAQGVRNFNDGISLLDIADGSLNELSNIVIRIKELAEQSANGTLSDRQRKALDREAQQLRGEYFRIAATTSFNGQKLFDGSVSTIALQGGYGAVGGIQSTLGGNRGDGTIGTINTMSDGLTASQDIVLGDLNGDGNLDIVSSGYGASFGAISVRMGNGDGSFKNASTIVSDGYASFGVSLADFNNDGALDIVTAGDKFGSGWDDSSTLFLGNGDGTFRAGNSFGTGTATDTAWDVATGDINGDGLTDLVLAGYDDAHDGYASVMLGRGNGTFSAARSYQMEDRDSRSVRLIDLNNDGQLDLATSGTTDSADGYVSVRFGTGTGTFGARTSYAMDSANSVNVDFSDLNGDGFLDMISAGVTDSITASITVRLGLGNGAFGTSVSFIETTIPGYDSMTQADINGDGFKDIVAGCNGAVAILFGNNNGTFAAPVSYTDSTFTGRTIALGDVNSDGVYDTICAGSMSSSGTTGIHLGSTVGGVAPLLDFSLSTASDSRWTMSLMTQTLNRLGTQRGTIGAFQSRLTVAVNNLMTIGENLVATSSRIKDADIATDAATLARLRILQSATATVLSQANQQPALALKLLSDV